MIVDCDTWYECGDIVYCVTGSRLWCEKLVNTITLIKRGDVCLILAPQPNSVYATVLTNNLKYGKVLKSLFCKARKVI